jgi:2-oxoglutarate dehydrogenase E2 component (dihydrolipoamide succinyltransferase)
MPVELKIPDVGESITEVQIAEWLKADGDEVKHDENVAMIDSEKTTLELPSPESGRLKILHQAGDTVKVGDVIAQIETNGDGEKSAEKSELNDSAKAADTKARETKPEDAKAKIESQAVPDLGVKTDKPEAKSEKKIPAEKVKAEKVEMPELKKPEIKEMVGRAAEEAPIVEENEEKTTAQVSAERSKTDSGIAEKIVPMTMLRRTAAKRLVEAKQQMAMLTTFNEADMSAVQSLRKEFQERFEKKHQTKLGIMSFFVRAVAGVLRDFPQLNAEIRGNNIVYHSFFDIGVAIASERGLVVPVLRNVEKMSFAEIEKLIAGFAKRAHEGKLKPEELEDGTFTITNGGVFGSLFSTPIINPPQTGILGMHAIQERPVAVQGRAVVRPMMFLALTYDHRLVDGREAVLFLQRVKEAIESPARMLIEA